MLMLFPTLKVNGLDDIDIFLDHQNPNVFYALRNRPRVATDSEGNPQLSFVFFARNADIAYASSSNKEMIESQLGQLLVTTDLGISKEEEELIIKCLTEDLKDTNSQNSKFIQSADSLLRAKKNITDVSKIKPWLGSISTWNNGVAKISILEGLGDTFKKQSNGEVKPSLGGNNSAAFYATFGIEGSQVMYDALTRDYSATANKKEQVPIQALIEYNLTGFAFVPNLNIKVSASKDKAYDYIKEHIESYNCPFCKRNIDAVKAGEEVINVSNVDHIIEKMRDDKIIEIEMTDFNAAGANDAYSKELESTIQEMVLNLITNKIIPEFFEEIPADFSSAEDEKEEKELSGSMNQLLDNSNFNTVSGTLHSYVLKTSDTVKKNHVSNLTFNFQKNTTVEFFRNPQGSLIADISPEQRKNLIKYIDISSPDIQVLTVQVHVNANFNTDNIHSIIVNLYYRQKDAKTGVIRENTKSFIYKTGDETNTFRVTMARNENGELIDYYDVEARIIYKGTSEAPAPIKLTDVSDRNLVISYDKLGFISVNCRAGDIDWDVIKEAIIQFEYPSASNKPDTQKDIRLSQENPSDKWLCYMYGEKDKSYKYKLKYISHDGRETEGQQKTDYSSELLIDDLLTDRLKAAFNVVLDTNFVKTAKVEILYQDTSLKLKDEFSRWFDHTETWDWTMRLQEGASNKFQYRYFVEYQDGNLCTSEWFTVSNANPDIPVINLRRYPKTLTIDGGMIDWSAWDMVYVTVCYKEEKNNYSVQKNFRLDQNNFLYSFEALAFEAQAKPFKYSLTFAKVGNPTVSVDEKEDNTGLLIIGTPQNI